MATEPSRLERKTSHKEGKRKIALTHTGLLMDGMGSNSRWEALLWSVISRSSERDFWSLQTKSPARSHS